MDASTDGHPLLDADAENLFPALECPGPALLPTMRPLPSITAMSSLSAPTPVASSLLATMRG